VGFSPPPPIVNYTDVYKLISDSEVIITCSLAQKPYIQEQHLSDQTRLIINTSLMDFSLDVITNSKHIIVDDWYQNTMADKVFKEGVNKRLILREHVLEIGEAIYGPRKCFTGRVFVNPLGMGLEDVYIASKIAKMINKGS
jgi:ornithine cyclodeaminase/alanine dehydrogenase-like protein (mu-crystallin family)